MDKEIKSILRQVPLLSEVDPQVIEALAQVAVEHYFTPGQVVIQEDAIGHAMYLIVEGSVQVTKGDGEELIVLATRGPGDLIGEMGLFESSPRFATIQALNTTRLLAFSEDDLRSVWTQQPMLLYRVVSMLSHRLREADMQMIADLTETNQELMRAYKELQEAQEALLEKELLESELDMARSLQQSILPDEFPDIPGLHIAAMSQPARQVGGDFYDVIPLGTGRVGLVMADVSDKGMPAALFMALTRSLIRAEARRSHSPRTVLININRLLLEMSHSDMFVTVFYGLLDMTAGVLRFSRAGHDRPLLINFHNKECRVLGGQGMALGVVENYDLEEVEVEVHPGELLLLYTDGITDANSPSGDLFGIARLKEVVSDLDDVHASQACDHIFERVTRFMDSSDQFDDMAMLVVSLDQVRD